MRKRFSPSQPESTMRPKHSKCCIQVPTNVHLQPGSWHESVLPCTSGAVLARLVPGCLDRVLVQAEYLVNIVLGAHLAVGIQRRRRSARVACVCCQSLRGTTRDLQMAKQNPTGIRKSGMRSRAEFVVCGWIRAA
jgi:hypothetical protein